MRKRGIILLVSYLSGILLLLSSCGTPQNGTPGSISASPQDLTASAQTPGSGLTTPTSDKVVITTDKSTYAPGEKIMATIDNGLSSPISVMDHQTSCTLLALQKQAGNTWVEEAPCHLSIATRMILISNNTSRVQALSPGSPTLWPAGLYRLMLTYKVGAADTSSKQASGSSATVYSSTFTIA